MNKCRRGRGRGRENGQRRSSANIEYSWRSFFTMGWLLKTLVIEGGNVKNKWKTKVWRMPVFDCRVQWRRKNERN